ncbi:hypothetical protein JQX13_25565 [Archangium violaceum]|uniref:hypothetical protein n=1 Tax=Archangium violaceum TaxID=83451 RepID=UPI00193BDAFE|nr:hypothetical protein [Archangium violaceum]QRK13096.1 hypothetical protein JQX13_25565 [Archangium violaceum]
MRELTQKFLVASLLALAGCEHEANSGRLVGFIVDGQTGQRLNFFQADGKKNNVDDDKNSQSQVYAVIDGEFRRAEPCGSGDLTEENAIEADGCYQINGIPEGMIVPIFAQAPGYERFVGEFEYPMLAKDQEYAQYVGNIRLFPKGYTTDYRFNVDFNGQPVAKAQVICQYLNDAGSSLGVSGDFTGFLTPKNTGTTTVSATSGDDGVAVIPGAQLVNGATYNCHAVLNQSLDGRTLSGQSFIVAGVNQTEQSLSLSAVGSLDSLLYAVRSNVDDGAKLLGADGKLVVTFNRPVEIVPGTADCQIASASIVYPDSDTIQGSINGNTPDNAVSEQVTAEVSGDGLTLTVGFRAEIAFDPDDRGTYVSFSGIVVRPRGITDSRQVRAIGAATSCPAVAGYDVMDLQNLRVGGGYQSNTIQLF